MLSQLRSLSPRRLLAMGLIVAGALIGILLIILWQAGLFDSAPPPATLESAVESVRQEEQAQQAQPESQAAQPQAQAQADEPTAQAAPQQQAQVQAATTQQEQGDSASSSYASQDQQADQQQAVSYDYGQQDSQQGQATEQQTGQASSQDSQQQAQQSGQSSQQSSDQQAEQAVMVPEDPELADLAGTWVLSQQGTSFVGYRIGEELANIGTTTAVGRTGDIVAALEFDGAVITSVVIEADLRTLESDQSFRDGALRTRGIETDTYPFATFVLTEPIPIDVLPAGEETLSVVVEGTLDLHGVTNPVIIALEGQYVDGLVVVVGSTEIALADYEIEKPTGFRVLSIEDVGIMEFQLVLELAP